MRDALIHVLRDVPYLTRIVGHIGLLALVGGAALLSQVRIDLPSAVPDPPTTVAEAREMDTVDFVELRTLVAASVRIDTAFFNPHGIPRTTLPSDVLIQFNSTPAIQVVFRKEPFKGHPVSWKGRWDFFGRGETVREAIIGKLLKLAAGD